MRTEQMIRICGLVCGFFTFFFGLFVGCILAVILAIVIAKRPQKVSFPAFTINWLGGAYISTGIPIIAAIGLLLIGSSMVIYERTPV